jgi:hypothetical protein
MPLPLDSMDDALDPYLRLVRACFSRPQGQHVVTVLLARMQGEEQRTLSALLRQVAGVGHRVDGLSRFLKDAPWHAEHLVGRWWDHYCASWGPGVAAEHARQRAGRLKRRGRPRKTVVTGFLLVDDPTHPQPKGRKMEGLGRHSASSAKKPVQGHCLFTSV